MHHRTRKSKANSSLSLGRSARVPRRATLGRRRRGKRDGSHIFIDDMVGVSVSPRFSIVVLAANQLCAAKCP